MRGSGIVARVAGPHVTRDRGFRRTSVPAPVLTHVLTYALTYANAAAERAPGGPREELVGRTHSEVFPMGLREVRDADGVAWTVFDVFPFERQLAPGRPAPTRLAPEMASGWLAFQSEAGERRRVVPTPPEWERLSDAELLRLLDGAAAVAAGAAGDEPPT